MIDAYAHGPAFDFSTLTGTEFRAAFKAPAPVMAVSERVKIEDRVILGAAHPMRIRLYRPEGDGPQSRWPITLYVHGGGFVMGGPEMTDGICCTLAEGAGTLIVSPDYRLAPEAPFPAGLEDCLAALQWAYDHAAALGGNAANMAVAGDSTGGNFAAVLAQMSRSMRVRLRHQLLLYPVLDHRAGSPSYTAYADGYFLTGDMMRWFWRQYLPPGGTQADWRASPMQQADLAGLPAATILTAEYDVLRDEAESYAARLIQAGVPVSTRRWPGQIHGFLLQQGCMDDADAALAAMAGALKSALA
jgi:acetyl esterase